MINDILIENQLMRIYKLKIQSYLFNLNLPFKSTTSLIKIYTLTCLFIIFVYLLTENTNISMYELVADPNEVGQVAPYTGLVSTIGILFLCGTVSVCLFSTYLIDTMNFQNRKWSMFFKYSGYFILLLLVDDLWQIHENIPNLLFLDQRNVSSNNKSIQNSLEAVIFGVYGAIFAIYLIRFKKLIYQTEFLILALALGFFGLSTTIDIFLESISGHFILEEGLKLLGIVSLLTYYTRVCYQKLRQSVEYSQEITSPDQ